MVKRHPHSKGFIAILSLLIVTSISMIMAVSLLKDGIDNASLSLSSIHYENARLNATICVEDNLIRIKKENQFNLNLDYDIEDNHGCTSTIQWYTPQITEPGRQETLADLIVSGTSGNFIRTFDYELKVKRTEVTYTDGSMAYKNDIDIISITETNN